MAPTSTAFAAGTVAVQRFVPAAFASSTNFHDVLSFTIAATRRTDSVVSTTIVAEEAPKVELTSLIPGGEKSGLVE